MRKEDEKKLNALSLLSMHFALQAKHLLEFHLAYFRASVHSLVFSLSLSLLSRFLSFFLTFFLFQLIFQSCRFFSFEIPIFLLKSLSLPTIRLITHKIIIMKSLLHKIRILIRLYFRFRYEYSDKIRGGFQLAFVVP